MWIIALDEENIVGGINRSLIMRFIVLRKDFEYMAHSDNKKYKFEGLFVVNHDSFI